MRKVDVDRKDRALLEKRHRVAAAADERSAAERRERAIAIAERALRLADPDTHTFRNIVAAAAVSEADPEVAVEEASIFITRPKFVVADYGNFTVLPFLAVIR